MLYKEKRKIIELDHFNRNYKIILSKKCILINLVLLILISNIITINSFQNSYMKYLITIDFKGIRLNLMINKEIMYINC